MLLRNWFLRLVAFLLVVILMMFFSLTIYRHAQVPCLPGKCHQRFHVEPSVGKTLLLLLGQLRETSAGIC